MWIHFETPLLGQCEKQCLSSMVSWFLHITSGVYTGDMGWKYVSGYFSEEEKKIGLLYFNEQTEKEWLRRKKIFYKKNGSIVRQIDKTRREEQEGMRRKELFYKMKESNKKRKIKEKTKEWEGTTEKDKCRESIEKRGQKSHTKFIAK